MLDWGRLRRWGMCLWGLEGALDGFLGRLLCWYWYCYRYFYGVEWEWILEVR